MSSKTKIVVLHMKEIIYTIIFVALGVLLLLLLAYMFFPSEKKGTLSDKQYTPGIYTSYVSLGNQNLEIEVSVSQNRITSLRASNLDETIATMYPLIQPAIEDLAVQIQKTGSIENLTFPEESAYTSRTVLKAVEEALEKAVVQ